MKMIKFRRVMIGYEMSKEGGRGVHIMTLPLL
jgi:hypothetical protein